MDNKSVAGRETYRSEWPPVTDLSFSEFFSGKLKELCELEGERITKRDIAEMVGISYEVFRKIINRRNATGRRDCIIAVCLALGADSKETDYALYCNERDDFLDEENERDRIIIKLLDSQCKERKTIAQINEILKFNFYPELDIIHSRKKTVPAAKNYPYRILTERIENNLCRLFNDEDGHFHVMDRMTVRDNKARASMEFEINGERIAVWADAENNFKPDRKKGEKFIISLYRCNVQKQIVEKFETPEDTGEFSCYYTELIDMAKNELIKINMMFYDSGSFEYLIGIKIIDNKLHIIAEVHNNSVSALDEYYFMDYSCTCYDMSVCTHSIFMKNLLDEDEFGQLYSECIKNDSDNAEKIDINDLRSKLYSPDFTGDFNEWVMSKYRMKYYDFLKKKISEFAVKLYVEEHFLFNADFFKDRNNDKYSCNAEGLFGCTYRDVDEQGEEFDRDELKYYVENLNFEKLEKEYYARNSRKKVIDDFSQTDFLMFPDGDVDMIDSLDFMFGWKLGFCTVEELLAFNRENSSLKIKDLLYEFKEEAQRVITNRSFSELNNNPGSLHDKLNYILDMEISMSEILKDLERYVSNCASEITDKELIKRMEKINALMDYNSHLIGEYYTKIR